MSARPRTFKVLLLGDSAVGKSSLISRIARRDFEPERRATVGIDFSRCAMTSNGTELELVLWDTSGQERFAPLAPGLYRDVDAVLYVYDVTRPASAAALTSRWAPAFERHATRAPLVVALLGNKTDAAGAHAVAPALEDVALAAGVSARTADGIEGVLAALGALLLARAPPPLPPPPASERHELQAPRERESTCCS